MPTTKSAAADANKKKKASSKKKEPRGEKKESSRSTSKDKDRSRSKEKLEQEQSATDAPVITETAARAQDADAVQLFRRYDRSRSGCLSRADFLQLLRDYAHQPEQGSRDPRYPYSRSVVARRPLSLTDSRGIPLGYERSDKNSEFEAGQLFERYDRDHNGSLTLEEFSDFFQDFQIQLRAFVDDLSYSATPPIVQDALLTKQVFESGDQTEGRTPSVEPTTLKDLSVVRAEYQEALWELRNISKNELQQQRDRLLEAIAHLHERLDPTSSESDRPHSPSHTTRSRWESALANQLADRLDLFEIDLERIESILRTTQRQLRKGMDQSKANMEAFLLQVPTILAEARELAMKSYGSASRSDRRVVRSQSTSHDTERYGNEQPQNESKAAPGTDQQNRPNASARQDSIPIQPNYHSATAESVQTTEEMRKTLRVKDQIIYQLLQERVALRKQHSETEAQLLEVTEVSTLEMKKWAQLTDEMQEEIFFLRRKLSDLESIR